MSFSCPLCHQPLSREKNSYICPQRHQFDMAKEGYVNLLPVQHKRSRDPGDSAEMMQARRAFLDAGHYQPLRDAIVAQLRERLDDKATAVLDIGCGEGYYTHAFADALPEITTFGLDVSKVAIKAAAKRYPQVTFCVASSHRLPFSDTSMDAIIRIYAPCKAEELARVVKPGGWVITATPGPRHLMELKGLIYNEVHLHAPHAEQLEGFTLQQSAELCYPMRLRGDEAVALLQMTPFAWRAKGNPLIYFAVATVLELVFGILASIITMWFSRHREFHADAGSAKLVGREKMIAALQRLKTSYEPQEATSMMALCINGKSKSLSELFMTHPPLDKRIEALRTGEYLK